MLWPVKIPRVYQFSNRVPTFGREQKTANDGTLSFD
jgi:hypothetical protein